VSAYSLSVYNILSMSLVTCQSGLLFSVSVTRLSCRCLNTLVANGPALGAVVDFGAQNCQYTTKVDAR